MDMDKFTKYAIYFLVGILAYYLLFNNGLVEGFNSGSPDNYQFTVAAVTGATPVALDVTLSKNIASNIEPKVSKPSFNTAPAVTIRGVYMTYTLCQTLINSITPTSVAPTTDESPSIFYMFSESGSAGFTYVMLNYTKPWVASPPAASAGGDTSSSSRPQVGTPGTKCNSIGQGDVSTFCPDGSAGLIDVANTTNCLSDSCTTEDDAAICCKPAPPMGTCTTADGVTTTGLESACGIFPDSGVYILKYPKSLESTTTEPPSATEVAQIEIYKTDDAGAPTTTTTTATLMKMGTTADDFTVPNPAATLKIKLDDKCIPDPCSGHGDCATTTSTSGFTCTCHEGYSGTTCSTAVPKPYTCGQNGTAVTGTTNDANTTNCAICNTGFYKTTGSNPQCLPVGKCINFDESKCETGDSKNASKTCEKPTCDKTDCCEDNYSIEIGITVGIIICIGLIIGAFYVFSSRSRHKAAHKVLSGKDTYIYK